MLKNENNLLTNKRMYDIIKNVKEVIAQLTNNDIVEIDNASSLFVELNINKEDFKRIIKKINQRFNISLDYQDLAPKVETVFRLAEEILDETELG